MSDQSVIIIAYILVPLSAVGGPLILNRMTRNQRLSERNEDWARQDEAAAALLRQGKKVADTLVESNATVAATAATQGVQLERIHTLVNSNLTIEKEAHLRSLEVTLVALIELLDFKKAQGITPTPEVLNAIATTKSAIALLRADLKDRLIATEIADANPLAPT